MMGWKRLLRLSCAGDTRGVGDSRGESEAGKVRDLCPMGVKYLKLVIPLLLALALLPISAFAEEEGNTEKSLVENPPVIYLDKKDPRRKTLSKDQPAPTGDRMGGPGVGLGKPLSESQRLQKQKEKAKEVPWHERYLKSPGIELEEEYVQTLPTPSQEEIDILRSDPINHHIGKVVEVDIQDIKWKYVGYHDVNGVKKYVWVTSFRAPGAKAIKLLSDRVNICGKCELLVYGNRTYLPGINDNGHRLSHWGGHLSFVSGDQIYLEYHSDSQADTPERDDFIIIKEYGYFFIDSGPNSMIEDQKSFGYLPDNGTTAECSMRACGYDV